MREIDLILKELHQSTQDIITTVENFPFNKFKIPPDVKRWSASEIMEHIFITEDLVNRTLQGKTRTTEIRDPEKKIELMRKILKDHSKKYETVEPIKPTNKSLDPQTGIKKFAKRRKLLEEIIKSEDLSMTCDDFRHFGFGYLTRVEWIYFNIFHGDRHRVQIENLKNEF